MDRKERRVHESLAIFNVGQRLVRRIVYTCQCLYKPPFHVTVLVRFVMHPVSKIPSSTPSFCGLLIAHYSKVDLTMLYSMHDETLGLSVAGTLDVM